MRETVREKQITTIQDELFERIRKSIPSTMFDTLFTYGALELKSIDDNKAVFVSDNESNALIIRSSLLDTITKNISDIIQCNVEVEIVDKNTYSKKNKLIEQAHSTFFQNSYLQKQYTFETFVVGSYNKDAYLASMFSVEYPAKSNPIFLYSKSGLGKTHLLHAIGNAYTNKFPNSKVLYITSDDFVTEFIRFTLGNKDSESLMDFFSTIDLLLVDDIQFLAKKEACQTMFFHVFNLLVGHQKQIILTSDCSPSELKGLPDRLVSRFAGGLSIPISSPNKDTLIEILKMKISNSPLDLSIFDNDVLDYLAFNYGKNVRELEGAYNNLLFAITTRKPTGNITLEFTKEVFEFDEKKRNKGGKIDVSSIIRSVAEYYNLTESQIKSKVRTSQIALARQIAMYLSRSLLNTPYQEIGKQFGKDHTTVLSNVNKIQAGLKSDVNLKKAIDDLTNIIKASK